MVITTARNATGAPCRRFHDRLPWFALVGVVLVLSSPLISSAALSGAVYVSDLTWTSMSNGWGPAEKNMSNGEQPAGDGRTLSINGVTYAKGLGVHAPSDIRYALGAACSSFTAVVGIDDEASSAGSVVFQVLKDGVKVYESPLIRKGGAAQKVTVAMTGGNELRLIVTDGGDGNNSDHADWANAQLACGTPAATASYLSDLNWRTIANGWGPAEKDMSNGEQLAGDGHTISINAVKYAKGLGVHAASDVRYTMNGACSNFSSDFGIDDESRPNGSVVFQVWADGTKLYDSGLVTGTGAAKSASVAVSGKTELQLVVTDGGNGNASDHADWANARLTCSSSATTQQPVNQPPTVSAGAAVSITLPTSATLYGIATDDGLPKNTLTTTWSLISGPAAMTFNPATALTTVASFSAAGTYTLRLTASDGVLSATSDVQVQVQAAPPPPPAASPTTSVLFPSDAGLLNVKTVFGAKGDGVTDDTQAIRNAIRSYYSRSVNYGFLYFPDGTYLVSDTLDWKDSNGAWHGYLAFRGQSQSGTIIKLKDNTVAFGNPAAPKAVIYAASEQADGNRADGGGDEAFRNGLFDLTVDTGKGNPGATGVNYIGSNQSMIRRITIRSGDGKGVVGLDISRPYTGPELFRDITITGFDTGILTGGPLAGATLEHITLQNQNSNGIANYENVLSIRDLTSTNTVPAIRNDQFPAALTLIDAKLTGGNGGAAIVNSGTANMYLRNIATSGYSSAANNNGTVVPGPTISEFTSNPATSMFPTASTSLNLPVQESPEFQDSNMTNWANVKSYGAVPDDYADDGVAIQAAIDSGKSTIYLPAGAYLLYNSVHIRGNVKRIVGYGAKLSPVDGRCPTANGSPAFIFDGATANTVIVEDVTFVGNWNVAIPGPEFSFPMLQHNGPQTVVLRNIMSTHYRNAAGSGPLFIENVCCGPFEFNNTTVWARQLDPELTGVHVTNNGSNLWILGLKTEGLGTIIKTAGGGKTELLGAYISLQQLTSPMADPGFINTESSHSLVFVTDTDHNFTTSVQETRGGVTKTIGPSSLPTRYKGSNVPLYVGYK